MKLWKWHTLAFRCPCCGKDADYAAQVVEGIYEGTYWDPSYWCEKCSTLLRARDRWLFGAAYGSLIVLVAAIAFNAPPPAWGLPLSAAVIFATFCSAVVGWPLSRALSRHLLRWEPRWPAALERARIRRLREDKK